MKTRSNITVLFLSIVLMLFTACLEIHTEVELDSDGSGMLTSRNSIPKELLAFSAFETPIKQLQLSLKKDYIEDYVQRLDGVELSSYKQDENETHVIVEAVYSFDSFEAMQRLLQLQSMDAQKISDDRDGIRWLITRGGTEDLPNSPFGDEIAELVKLSFSISTPEPLTSMAPELVYEKSGNSVSFRIPAEDLLYAQDEYWLEFLW